MLGRFYPLIEELLQDFAFDLGECVYLHVFGGKRPPTEDDEDACSYELTLRRWRELERYLEAMLSMRLDAVESRRTHLEPVRSVTSETETSATL